MDHSFDRDIKQKLQDATPEEAGYRPDRDKLWQQIEAKKTKKPKTLLFWFSHAAAVAAGLLIGVFFLYPGNKTQHPDTVTGNAAPVIKTIRDTVYLPQTNQVLPVAIPATLAQQNRQYGTPSTQAIKNNPAAALQPTAQQLPVIAPAPQEPVLAVNVPKQPKVLHLSDIDNENAHPKQEQQKVYVLFKIIRIPITSEDQTGTLTMSISEQLSQSIKN